jgi:hypothetical protein
MWSRARSDGLLTGPSREHFRVRTGMALGQNVHGSGEVLSLCHVARRGAQACAANPLQNYRGISVAQLAFMNDDPLRKGRAIQRAQTPPPLDHASCHRVAIDAAVFAAELTARCAQERSAARDVLALQALRVVREPQLHAAIERAILLASGPCALDLPAEIDPVTRTLALCTWAFVGAGDSALNAIMTVIRAGGDSEGAGAIVGGWLSVLHGLDARAAVTRAA